MSFFLRPADGWCRITTRITLQLHTIILQYMHLFTGVVGDFRAVLDVYVVHNLGERWVLGYWKVWVKGGSYNHKYKYSLEFILVKGCSFTIEYLRN